MLPHGDCWSEEFDACCDKLFNVVDDLRGVAYTAVQECIDETACLSPLRTYVAIDEPADPMSDYVVAWIPNVLPMAANDPAGRFNFAGGTSTVFISVRLLETGYPLVRHEEDKIIVPDARQHDVAARHSYGHGEKMYRAIANWVIGNSCDRARFVSFQPAARSGGSVGWEAQVAIEKSFDR